MNKKIKIIIALVILLFSCTSCNKQSALNQGTFAPLAKNGFVTITRKYSGLKVQAKLKGIFVNYEDPDLNLPTCYLIQVDLINDTDSTLKFVTQRAGPYVNVALENKGYSLLGPSFLSNGTVGDVIESGQIFSFLIIIYQNKDFDSNHNRFLRVGFIYLSWDKSYGIYDQLPKLFFTWKKTYENVIWSEPIELATNKQHAYDYLRIINDSTFSYSKHY